jgi:hypothetical protein
MHHEGRGDPAIVGAAAACPCDRERHAEQTPDEQAAAGGVVEPVAERALLRVVGERQRRVEQSEPEDQHAEPASDDEADRDPERWSAPRPCACAHACCDQQHRDGRRELRPQPGERSSAEAEHNDRRSRPSGGRERGHAHEGSRRTGLEPGAAPTADRRLDREQRGCARCGAATARALGEARDDEPDCEQCSR